MCSVCLQFRHLVLAQEGQGRQAGRNPCEDGDERGCTKGAIERGQLSGKEAEAERRPRSRGWFLRPLCLNKFVAYEWQVSVTPTACPLLATFLRLDYVRVLRNRYPTCIVACLSPSAVLVHGYQYTSNATSLLSHCCVILFTPQSLPRTLHAQSLCLPRRISVFPLCCSRCSFRSHGQLFSIAPYRAHHPIRITPV